MYMELAKTGGFVAEYKSPTNKSHQGNSFDSSRAMKRRLRRFMTTYEITSYMHLQRLLGVQGGSTVWKWFNTTQRPSARYTSRLLELSMWAGDGVPLKEIEYIDWDLKRLVWKAGYREPRRYLSTRDWKHLPDSEVA